MIESRGDEIPSHHTDMTDSITIPLHSSVITESARRNVEQVLAEGAPGGGGRFTELCETWLEQHIRSPKALLTASASQALEMCALLLDIGPGDEVILPSWSFPSTANAFVLRGATPVFVDIRPDTLNLDEQLIEAALTSRTRAIVVVHYGGIAGNMAAIMKIARNHGLAVVEDAAQGLLARYDDRPLGSLGDLGVISFHQTKNIGCGEAGALLVNNEALQQRAEILRDKGTNRAAFRREEVAFYEWSATGVSGPPGEINAALLAGQLDAAAEQTASRRDTWWFYHSALQSARTQLRLPCEPNPCRHNGHIFAIRTESASRAARLQDALADQGVQALPHYRPLHLSPEGQRIGRAHTPLPNTEDAAQTLLRLPLWPFMGDEIRQRVVDAVLRALSD